MPKRYIASIPNPKCNGPVRELFYSDDAAGHARAAAFAQREDVPGRAVYDAINLYRDDACRRNLETVEAIVCLPCDIDLKDIEEDQDTVVRRLSQLPYSPSEIRLSGHGVHAIYNLKEPASVANGEARELRALRTRLTEFLCADLSIDNDAALLRRLGTTNSKNPESPVQCAIVAECGATYDPMDIAELLDDYGTRPLFTRKTEAEDCNAGQSPFIARNGPHVPVDVEAELAAMQYGDPKHGVNKTHRRVIPSLLRHGHTPDEVIDRVVAATMNIARTAGLRWNHTVEVGRVTSRCVSALRLIQKESSVETPPWLPPEFLDTWTQVQARGKRPYFARNGAGWHVRGYDRPGPDKEAPAPQQASSSTPEIEAPPHVKPGPATAEGDGGKRKYRFPLLRFGEMRPGTEPNYLVDELIPVAGLVLVYGAPKGGKSFWALDLTLHVALGWEYRERAVQQGTVIYCAFEGAHGYRKRCEAFRRHHCFTDEDPPLYVVPGRADLIKDHASLIREMRDQIAPDQEAGRAGSVRCVVLDTLNKSLIGSESKDVDMANYIAAAEAIQAAFGCVVMIVHHHGIDESRPRGHTSLRGAVDAQIKIVRDDQNNIIAEIEDMRDGPEGAQIMSRLVVVPVGTDRAGRPLSSAAIEPVDPGTRADGQKLPKLSANQRSMFFILEAAPAGLTTDEWNDQAREAGLGVKRRTDLLDLRNGLRKRNLVCQNGGRWFVTPKFSRGAAQADV